MVKRRRHSAKFKFKVALEAAKGTKTLGELASEYQFHPSQISDWESEAHRCQKSFPCGVISTNHG